MIVFSWKKRKFINSVKAGKRSNNNSAQYCIICFLNDSDNPGPEHTRVMLLQPFLQCIVLTMCGYIIHFMQVILEEA